MVHFRIECHLPFPREDLWRVRGTTGFMNFLVEDGLLKVMTGSPIETDATGYQTRVQQYCITQVECPPFVRNFVGESMFTVDDYQRWNDDVEKYRQHFIIRPHFLKNLTRTIGALTVDPLPEPEKQKGTRAQYVDDGMDEVSDEQLSSADASTDAEGSEQDDSSDSSEEENGKDLNDVQAYMHSLPTSQKCLHVVEGEASVSILTIGWFIERSVIHNMRLFYKRYPASAMRFRKMLFAKFAGGDETLDFSIVVDRFLESEEKQKTDLPQQDNELKQKGVFVSSELEWEEDSDNDLLCVE